LYYFNNPVHTAADVTRTASLLDIFAVVGFMFCGSVFVEL